MGAAAADWAVAALLGALVGTGELVSRYRDAPDRALRTFSAYLYVALNALASMAALVIVRAFGWTFGATTTGEELRWTQVLAAGFGAMVFFRSAFFMVRIGDQDVGIGPSGVLQVLLSAVDQGVDRARALARDVAIAPIMAGISFGRSYQALPAYCFGLMQNLTDHDQKRVGDELRALRESAMDDAVKARLLGLVLMNVIGEDVVRAAVRSLAAIEQDQDGAERQAREAVAALMRDVSFARAAESLPAYCLALARDVGPEEQARLAQQIVALRNAGMSDAIKSMLLGLTLAEVVGPDVLGAAVSALREEVTEPSPAAPGGA